MTSSAPRRSSPSSRRTSRPSTRSTRPDSRSRPWATTSSTPGYDDLVNRVMAPYDATTNPLGGAEWQYIAANLRKKSDDSHAVAGTWIKDFGDVQVGFVGAVTEDLPSLVSPDGIADIKVDRHRRRGQRERRRSRGRGRRRDRAPRPRGCGQHRRCAAATDPNSAFGQIVNGVDTNIDAIVSGHTHLAYNHSVPVPAVGDRGSRGHRLVRSSRPVSTARSSTS